MKKSPLVLRFTLIAVVVLALAGCAGAPLPVTGGGLIDTLELPALPQWSVAPLAEAAALSQSHAAASINALATYNFVSPYSWCEH